MSDLLKIQEIRLKNLKNQFQNDKYKSQAAFATKLKVSGAMVSNIFSGSQKINASMARNYERILHMYDGQLDDNTLFINILGRNTGDRLDIKSVIENINKEWMKQHNSKAVLRAEWLLGHYDFLLRVQLSNIDDLPDFISILRKEKMKETESLVVLKDPLEF